MHNGRIHVIPEPDGQSTVPSSVPLDTASLVAGAAATGLATGEMMSPGFVAGLLASLSLPSGIAGMAAPLAQSAADLPQSRGLLPFVVFFGFVSVILGTWNLVQGLRRRARCEALSRRAEELLHHDKSFTSMLETFDVHIHGHEEESAGTPAVDHTH